MWQVSASLSTDKRAPLDDAAMSAHIASRQESARVASARLNYIVFAAILSMIFASIVSNTVLGKLRWMTTGQDVIFLVMFAVVSLVNVTPALARRPARICYALTMLAIAIFVWCGSPEFVMTSIGVSVCVRLLLSLAHLRVADGAVWNSIVTLSTCSCLLWNNRGDTTALTVCVYEVCATALILLAVAAFERWTLTKIRQEIQVGVLKSEASASMRLLDLVCDVVIELDGDLAIARDSPAMTALLMRGSNASSIAGMSFCDFISDEDEQQSFKDCLPASHEESQAMLGTCRVRLVDSLSSIVNTDVFMVQVNRFGEDCRYILGIREFTDVIPEMKPVERRKAKRVHRSAQKGTPPGCEYVSLQAGGTPEAGEAGAPGGAGGGPLVGGAAREAEARPCRAPVQAPEALYYPELVETKRAAMCKGMMIVMNTWNVRVPRSACCALHAYVMEAHTICRDRLMPLGCLTDFPARVPAGMQCQACGALEDDDATECPLCESMDLRLLPKLAPNEGGTSSTHSDAVSL